MKLKKKLVAALLAAAMTLSLTACAGDGNTADGQQALVEKPALSEQALTIDALGMALELPAPLYDRLGTLLFPTSTGPTVLEGVVINGAFLCEYQSDAVYRRVVELQASGAFMDDEEFLTLSQQAWTLFGVFSMNSKTITEETDLAYLTGFDTNTKIAELGDTVFYLSYNAESNTEALSEEDVAIYAELEAALPQVADGFVCYTPIVAENGMVTGASLEGLSATDFEGNVHDVSLFAEHKLTLVNIWATDCPPCVDEMPELEQIAADYADRGVQVVGICADGETNPDMAREILSATGVTYVNLLPDEFIRSHLFPGLNATPTSFFVDENGVIVGSIFKGARSYEGFAELIDTQLALLEGSSESEAAN